MNTIEAFGAVLKKYRKEANMTQEELALSCGLDRTYIGLLERAKRQPTISTIFVICKEIEIEPHKLIKEIERLVNVQDEVQ